MIRLLQFLFLGHTHKWKTIEESKLELWGNSQKDVRAIGTRYVQQCEKCGVIAKRDII